MTVAHALAATHSFRGSSRSVVIFSVLIFPLIVRIFFYLLLLLVVVVRHLRMERFGGKMFSHTLDLVSCTRDIGCFGRFLLSGATRVGLVGGLSGCVLENKSQQGQSVGLSSELRLLWRENKLTQNGMCYT